MKQAILLTTAALATSTSLSACASVARGPAAGNTAASKAKKIDAFESDANGFNTKNFFYDNGEEVVVFDTQFTPAIAEQAVAYIRSKTSNPITTVVITHPNPDKFNGASVFQKLGARVIASEATARAIPDVHTYKKYFFVQVAKMFTEETYPQQAHVDQTFSGAMDLKLRNGETIRLQELQNPGVSSTQTVAWIPEAKAVIVGDLVHHKAHAWLEGGIVNGKAVPTLQGWISDLRELAALFPQDATVYGGRGEAAPLREAVTEQIAYLQKADQLASQYAKTLAGRTPDYEELQKIFEANFPGYGLGYMIQYGAYGLVSSKL